MGEAHRYEVGQEEENNPTLEEQANAIDVQAQEQAEEASKPMTYSEEDTRPEWLPEKFDNVEEMAKAYGELESKMGSGEEVTEETTPAPDNQESAINLASEEFSEKGELSEETYKALEAQGLNKIVVDSYIAGQQAIVNQQQMEITAEIGGMQEYSKLSNWAAENLSDSDLEAYNLTVESGTVDQAKFAIRSLYKQYQDAGAPNIAQGSVNGTGIPPFQSRAQVTVAMRDSRYETDPAYRDEVLKRLARSNV
tara:strand:+ start:366 stop:1121 length:756 start_codon:yes stop_codon:yes gene_type:complete